MKASLEDNSSYEESLGKAEPELETAKVMLDEYIRSASVSQSILKYSSTALLERWKASHATVLSKSFVKRMPICPWDCWILYAMLAAYDALLFCLNREKKATHVKGPLLTHFSAFLVISGALPATEGTPVAFLLLHPCSHYD